MLYNLKIAHRAIHPGHIMIEKKSDGKYMVKIIDFSNAVYVTEK